MILRGIKLVMLLLSNFGYWEYFRTKHKINIYFAPVFTIAIQFGVLFAAGLLNYLREAAILLCVIGDGLLVVSVRNRKLEIAKPYLNIGFLYFSVVLAVVALYTNNRIFLQSDNFTHWGTVVKNMLSTNRFPGSLDTAVEFTSYPLGSSAMIYYYCKFLGWEEDSMMLAQSFIMICSMLPVYAFVRKRIGISTILIASMTVLLFQYNIPVTELLVDTVLPLAGMATLAFAYHQCVIGEDGEKRSVYYALPMMIWTMNIKHAALLYVAGTLIVLYFGTDNETRRNKILNSCLILLAARSLWNRHCSYIDPKVSTSQHALSLSWFSKIASGKTKEEILRITQDFLGYVVTRREFYWILAWVFCLSLIVFLILRQKKMSGRVVLCVMSVYVIYAMGVLGMYIFSMPAEDGLIAVDRYMKSGDIAIYYMLLLFAVEIVGRIACRSLIGTVGSVLLILSVCSVWFQTGEYSNVSLFNCTVEERQRWEAPIEEYGMSPKQSYLLCVSQEEYAKRYYFPRYIWQYHMETASVTQIVVTEASQLDMEWKYDYVVIFDDENPVIKKWMLEKYPENLGGKVIQHFG